MSPEPADEKLHRGANKSRPLFDDGRVFSRDEISS